MVSNTEVGYSLLVWTHFWTNHRVGNAFIRINTHAKSTSCYIHLWFLILTFMPVNKFCLGNLQNVNFETEYIYTYIYIYISRFQLVYVPLYVNDLQWMFVNINLSWPNDVTQDNPKVHPFFIVLSIIRKYGKMLNQSKTNIFGMTHHKNYVNI